MHRPLTNQTCSMAGVGVDQVKKFEQVSSDDHRMSVAGGGGRYPGPMSGDGGGGVQWGPVYHGKWSHGNPPPFREQTDDCETITFPQLRLRAVASTFSGWLCKMTLESTVSKLQELLTRVKLQFAWTKQISFLPWTSKFSSLTPCLDSYLMPSLGLKFNCICYFTINIPHHLWDKSNSQGPNTSNRLEIWS